MEQFPLSPSRVGSKSCSLKQTAGMESGVRRNLKHVSQPKENGIFKTDIVSNAHVTVDPGSETLGVRTSG